MQPQTLQQYQQYQRSNAYQQSGFFPNTSAISTTWQQQPVQQYGQSENQQSEERANPDPWQLPSSSPQPVPAASPLSNAEAHYGDGIVGLVQMYPEESKYSGENDMFAYKLIIFHDLCRRAGVPEAAKARAFSVMLKGLALDYYYASIFDPTDSTTFDQKCQMIRNFFEHAEFRRSNLLKWTQTSLKSIMNEPENEGESISQCFRILVANLRHLQYGLDPECQTEKFMYYQLILACQEVPACYYACCKPPPTLTDLINDLQSSIATYQMTHQTEFFPIDRRYQNRVEERTRQPSRTHASRDRLPPSAFHSQRKKKCFVCNKERCWSTKHTRKQQDEAKERFKERLMSHIDIKVSRYIFNYEGIDPDLGNERLYDLNEEMKTMRINATTPLVSTYTTTSTFPSASESTSEFFDYFK